jgi:hypothetical protein
LLVISIAEETSQVATIHEAYEEGGIVMQEDELVFAHLSHSIIKGGKEYIQFYFSCTKCVWGGEIRNMEPKKCHGMQFFPLNTLLENIIPYIRNALENYKKSHLWRIQR